MTCEPRATPGSGNPYADLGMADAELRLAKAQAARKITAVTRVHGLTQPELAAKQGIEQAQMARIARRQLAGFTREQLTQLADTLADLELPASALQRTIA